MESYFVPDTEIKINNVCRCCLTENAADFVGEHETKLIQNVITELLKDVFNIEIIRPQHPDQNLKICHSCSERLNDASNFKQMVLQNNDTYLKISRRIHCDEAKPPDPLLKANIVKTEELLVTIESVECDDFGGNLDNNDMYNLDLNKSELLELPMVKSLKKQKRLLEKCPKVKKKKRSKGIDFLSMPHQSGEKTCPRKTEHRGNGPILRENSLKVIKNSSICVFQWNKSRYRCFCCEQPFSDINLLKQHTNNEHSLENIEKKIIAQQNRLVKVEVSIIYCTICYENMTSLDQLKCHLNVSHGIEIKEDLLVPFKIQNELNCQICGESFRLFRLLNIHMNRHYQTQICHICGAGFSHLIFLNLHKTRAHRPIKCKICKAIFNNKTDVRSHNVTVHGVRYEKKQRYPCFYCSERFSQENIRVLHLTEKHGVPKPEFQCGVCDKTFVTQSLRNNHFKKVHNKEKNQQCDVCRLFFYSKSDVLRHMVTHTGEKNFSCDICCNVFASKDSVRRHMKRSHLAVN